MSPLFGLALCRGFTERRDLTHDDGPLVLRKLTRVQVFQVVRDDVQVLVLVFVFDVGCGRGADDGCEIGRGVV